MPRAKSQDKLIDQNQPDGAQIAPQPYACSDDAVWGGFLNFRVDDDTADEFFAWYRSPKIEEAWGLLWTAVAQGIKMSLAYDAKHDAWICTFTGSLLRDGKRYAMTSRGGDATAAIMLQTYKHAVLLDGDYSPTKSEKTGWQRFG